MLTTEGRLYQITGLYGVPDGGVSRKSFIELPTNSYRQGEPKTLQQVDLLSVVGSIDTATGLTVTNIVDGYAGQTVTATFNAVGSAGKVDLTGSTVSGSDITFVSWLTSEVYMLAENTNITVQFVIDAADVPTLNPPDAQPQTYNITLVVNGV